MRGGGSEEGDTDPRTYLRVRRVLQSSTDTCDLNKCVAFIDDNTPKATLLQEKPFWMHSESKQFESMSNARVTKKPIIIVNNQRQTGTINKTTSECVTELILNSLVTVLACYFEELTELGMKRYKDIHGKNSINTRVSDGVNVYLGGSNESKCA